MAAFAALCLVGAGRVQAQGPAQRRVVLKLGGWQAQASLERARGRPYPEFLLQRWDAGTWRVHPAEEFRRGEGQVVIPITEPGTYRVVAAASPFELYESSPVVVRDGDKQVMTTLQAGGPVASCDVYVTSSRTGRPLGGHALALSGPYGSLPPLRGVTDADGRLRLGRVRTQELHVELEHAGDEPLAWEAARRCLESGRADLRVPW